MIISKGYSLVHTYYKPIDKSVFNISAATQEKNKNKMS